MESSDPNRPPPLPGFIARRFPVSRRMLTLRSGPDAGRRIHLVDHGPQDGTPVLLVHGNPTWSFLWRKVIDRLEGLRCVAPDLLGLGLSDNLPKLSDHTLERHIAAVYEVVEQLGLERPILVGQDWGGPVAVGVGARLGEAVRGVVLANTSVLAPRRPRGTAFHRFARLPLVSDLAFRVLGLPQRLLHRLQADPSSIRGEVARAYRWPLRMWGRGGSWRNTLAPLALARMVPDCPEHPSMEALRRGEAWLRAFPGSVALVWGTSDPILGRALERHREALPNAAVTETTAGHFLQEEVPEKLAAAVTTNSNDQGETAL